MGMRRRRGIYLASVLMVIALLAMVLGAAVKIVEGTAVNGSTADIQAALNAANSGLRYARARLAANYKWRGDGNGWTVQTSTMAVYEDNGNVTGIVRAPGGQFAQFRIRFNWQNGAATGKSPDDGLNDPVASSMWFTDDPYVSVNNIVTSSSSGPATIYRAGSNGVVDPATSYQYPDDVPASAACIFVEGRAGPAMRNLNSDSVKDLNAQPIPGSHWTSRVVEAFLQAAGGSGANAAIEACGNVTFNLPASGGGNVTVGSGPGGPPPGPGGPGGSGPVARLRSHNGTVAVNLGTTRGAGAYTTPGGQNGEVIDADGNLAASYNSSQITVQKGDSGGFYRLPWSQVKKASSSGPSLPAGTYVVDDSGNLNYYAMTEAEYMAAVDTAVTNGTSMPTPTSQYAKGSTVLTVGGKPYVTFDGKHLNITGNVYVASATDSTSSASINDFAFIPTSGAQSKPPGASGGGGGITTSSSVSDVSTAATTYVTGIGATTPSSSLNATWTGLSGNLPGLGLSVGGSKVVGQPSGADGSGVSWHVTVTRTGSNSYSLNLNDNGMANLGMSTGSSASSVSALESAITGLYQDPTYQSQLVTLLNALTGAGGGMQMNGAAATTKTRAQDIGINFNPPKKGDAILSSDGKIDIGGNINGTGSITAGGTLNMVAPGSNLSSSQDDGISLYAKGNISLSTLQQPGAKTAPSAVTNWQYHDFHMQGVIYTCGNFTADVGATGPSGTTVNWGNFNLNGALVAYGGDPASVVPSGSSYATTGTIDISAKGDNIQYNPAYLVMMDTSPPPGPLTRTFYTQF